MFFLLNELMNFKSDSIYTIFNIILNVLFMQKRRSTQAVVQRYADDVFYAFTRGDVLVALTRGEGCQRTLDYHGFKEGETLCDALNTGDCITVQGGKLNINMGQDPKVYVKK